MSSKDAEARGRAGPPSKTRLASANPSTMKRLRTAVLNMHECITPRFATSMTRLHAPAANTSQRCLRQ